MPSLYDRADIYDLFETEERFNAYKRHWEYVLRDAGDAEWYCVLAKKGAGRAAP